MRKHNFSAAPSLGWGCVYKSSGKMEKLVFEKNVISGPNDWNLPSLKELDRMLRCPICFEYIKTAMILPCSHSYCSLCIRRYLQIKDICPVCCKVVNSKLINNLIVDQLVKHFIKNRSSLMALCQSTSNSLQQNKSSIKNDIPESVSMQIHHNDEEYIVPPVPSSLLLSDDEDELVLKEEDEVNVKEEDEVNVKVEDQEDCESPSLFASPFAYKDLKRVETRRELCFGDVCNKSDNSCVNSEDKSVVCDGGSNQCDDEQCISTPRNLSTSTLSDFNGVECPVCGIHILERTINNHLDICLKYSTSRQRNTNSPGSQPLPRLPKLCYTLMRDSQLRVKLREYHLPPSRSRQQMISRLREFTLQYNVQCDSNNPKTIKQIAQQVESFENSILSPYKKSSGLQLNRTSTEEEIQRECEKYVSSNKEQFISLVNHVKKRKRSLSHEEDKTERESVTGMERETGMGIGMGIERETGMQKGMGMGNKKGTGKEKGRGQQRGTGKKRRDGLRSRSQEMQAGELVTEIQKLGKLEEYEKKKDEKEDEGDEYDHRDPPFLPFKKPKRRKT